MKFISVEEFQNNLRASICWNKCTSTLGCSHCDQGLSIGEIIHLLDKQSNNSDTYLFDASKFLSEEKK